MVSFPISYFLYLWMSPSRVFFIQVREVHALDYANKWKTERSVDLFEVSAKVQFPIICERHRDCASDIKVVLGHYCAGQTPHWSPMVIEDNLGKHLMVLGVGIRRLGQLSPIVFAYWPSAH